MKTFQERLLELMEIKHLSKAELAQQSGLSKATITRYLQGQFKAKQDTIYEISKNMNINPGWLLGHDVDINGFEEKEEAPEAEPQRLTKTQEELIEMVKGLDEDRAHKVQQLIALLLGQ